jgi:adenine-specific DNA-methyltransferase
VLEKLPDFPPDIKDVLMADLIYKMSRHVNTAGIMIAYKKFGSSEQRDLKRICGDIVLEVPQIVNGPKGAAFRCDALSFLEHPPMRYDCIYLDPPYTPRQYLQYYHLLEYACIPFAQRYRPLPHQVSGIDPSMYRSPYATRRDSQNAFEALVRQACNVANGLVLSYSEAGLLSEDFISSTLSQYGVIHIQKIPSSKYSGGINKKNELTEFLFSLRVT